MLWKNKLKVYAFMEKKNKLETDFYTMGKKRIGIGRMVISDYYQ